VILVDTATSKELARSTRSGGGLVWLERAVEEMPTWAGGRGGNGGNPCAEGCHCRVAPDPEGEHPVKQRSCKRFRGRLTREMGERQRGTDALEISEVAVDHGRLAGAESKDGIVRLPPLVFEQTGAVGRVWASRAALVLLRQGRQAQFQDAFEEPVASFFEFQERFLGEGAQLLFGPSAGIVEHETTRLAIEFFFFKELRDAHGFNGLASRMCEEESETFLLECWNAELV